MTGIFEPFPYKIFPTQVNTFLKKCTQAKKRRKRPKIEPKLETEAKRLKAFNPVEKSSKLSPKSALTKSAQKIPEEDPCSKWLLQTDSSSTSKLPKTDSSSTSNTDSSSTSTIKLPNTDSSSTSKLPKTQSSKAPPLPPPACLVAPLPLKRKGPGRQ